MPRHCRTIKTPGGYAIICGDFPTHRCRCGGEGRYQCDYPTKPGKTCDAYLCWRCCRPQGRGVDYCPKHAQGEE